MGYPLLHFLLVVVLLVAAVADLRSHTIPNWLTLPAMVGGLVGHSLFNGQPGLLFSLKGLGLGLALLLIPYLMGGMGAGDVKLLAAVGSFVGPSGVLAAALVTALLGGVYAVAVMMKHWGPRSSLQRVGTMVKTWVVTGGLASSPAAPGPQPKLRYGLVIGLGTLISQWCEGFLICT